MNPEDMRERNLKTGQVVDLTSHFDDGERYARHFIVVPYDIPPRCTATYFPEANVLVPIGSTADRSNTPVSKFVRITVAPHESKTGEAGIVGKFDYDYVEGYAQTPVQRSLSHHRAKSGFLNKINLENVVSAAVWVSIIGAAARSIYNSQFNK
jgi:hypothetical protein